MQPRSLAIPKTWKTFSIASLFSAFLYPALGIALLTTMIVLGAVLQNVALHWYYLPLGLGVTALAIFLCNCGIGPLHRIWQHRAGELKWPAQLIVAFNCALAMQGSIKDWINYHSQHHRFADQPGDPHNPFESKRWAWVGWILWRDPKDMERPMPLWLKENRVVALLERRYNTISLVIHLVVPAAAYMITWALGGSLILVGIIHASVVIGRAIQFHATTLGINVLGHLPTPKWADHAMALLTGGEAYHDHHHDEPSSILHLPRKGLFNRIFDYNGTTLLVFEKLGWAKDLKVAPQFN
ncbi:MAG: acyl-CoA desaturase [Pseudomonadota bacterium]